MKLSALDWGIVSIILLAVIITGLVVSRRASKNAESFFLGGRNMPWWLLGTSMVATTFATDTPNLVTGLVREHGVAGNWGWWAFLITGMVTAFIYAKLWRRLGVTTDIEFYELRYSGRPAAFLRGLRAVYLGLFFNILVMANVTLALVKYGNVLFGISPVLIVLIAGTVTVLLSVSGGLLGVLVTDFFLFIISMIGAVAAAWFAINHGDVGGLKGLMSNTLVMEKRSFLPDFSDPNQYVPLLLVPLLMQWWSAWYPGSEPGGGGYIAQRMLAAKNERHATGAVLLFNVAHYALRPWPWILVALASLVVFPDLASLKAALPHVDAGLIQNDLAYPAMLTFLPSGLLGLVVASILAAYVSTMSTMLNLGSSYIVNDVYGRFIKPDASERARIFVGRMVIVLLMVGAALLALVLESAMQAFRLLLSMGAGTGLLFFLRWFWRRINAWSEIAAMVLSLVVAGYLEFYGPEHLQIWQKFALTVGLTTLGWVLVTLLTPKTNPQTLQRFEDRIADASGSGDMKASVKTGLAAALFATLGVYGLLFGTGSALYGQWGMAVGLFLGALLSGWLCWRFVRFMQ
jgi:solute:Na+ symporter, SSS family